MNAELRCPACDRLMRRAADGWHTCPDCGFLVSPATAATMDTTPRARRPVAELPPWPPTRSQAATNTGGTP